jgi:hypothetical protein
METGTDTVDPSLLSEGDSLESVHDFHSNHTQMVSSDEDDDSDMPRFSGKQHINNE